MVLLAHLKWPKIIASRMEFLPKNNERACSFIRDLRVQGQNEQSPPITKIDLTYIFT